MPVLCGWALQPTAKTPQHSRAEKDLWAEQLRPKPPAWCIFTVQPQQHPADNSHGARRFRHTAPRRRLSPLKRHHVHAATGALGLSPLRSLSSSVCVYPPSFSLALSLSLALSRYLARLLAARALALALPRLLSCPLACVRVFSLQRTPTRCRAHSPFPAACLCFPGPVYISRSPVPSLRLSLSLYICLYIS